MRVVNHLAALAAVALVALLPTAAWGIGEVITEIQIQDNVRTHEDTIRSIAGIDIGDELKLDTLEKVRERLHTSGLFADVNVFWEPYRHGVRVNIVVKDKFPWASVPTLSYSPGNISLGAVVAHGNLFGRGKRGLLAGRLSTADSGGLVAFEDPALFGSWMFYQLKGRFQDQIIPEYSNRDDLPGLPTSPLRETKLRSYGGEASIGVAWFRKVKTSLGWSLDQYNLVWSRPNADNAYAPADLPDATAGARRAAVIGNVTFDFRAREHAVMYGSALSMGGEYGSENTGSDYWLDYWKASASYELGLRFFRKHNIIAKAGAITGARLPMWSENWAGASNLRGFFHRQFSGDTHLRTQLEYHFPLLSIMQLQVRGLVFNDNAAIYYRNLPPRVGNEYQQRLDGRHFLPPDLLQEGFDPNRDVHTSFGAGLRFYLKSVAVPLVGVDFGHGLGTGTVRMVLVIGA